MQRAAADVVIVGSGAAGLYTALNLPSSLRCAVLTKSGPGGCNSMYAQGGIAAVVWPNREEDDPGQHLSDTLAAGAGLCDLGAARVLVEEAWENIEELIGIEVPFDREGSELLLTREGGHKKRRILHCGGDATGALLTRTLREAARERENILLLDKMFLCDIVTGGGRVAGVVALDGENTPWYIASPCVVLATGGVGRVYRHTTNDLCATGDGHGAALRAGAVLKDMEFIQFHPTAFARADKEGRHFLISEALRGEGAVLRNDRGEAFMASLHPLADLAPRDVVSRAVAKEMERRKIPHVYLDATRLPRDFLAGRFPTIYNECRARGVDIARELIPVLPVAHYCMGGIQTGSSGETGIEGLYACGEAACTGVHGANRLASNSLLECLVFGRRCARHIEGKALTLPEGWDRAPEFAIRAKDESADFAAVFKEIRRLMSASCGIIRSQAALRRALAHTQKIIEDLEGRPLALREGAEAYNLALVARAVQTACLGRPESVGAHFRGDTKAEEKKREARA